MALPEQDRPLFAKDGRIIFASTHRPARQPRQGWTAIYSMSGGARLPMQSHRLLSLHSTMLWQGSVVRKCPLWQLAP